MPSRTPGVDRTAVPDQRAVFTPGEGWVDLPWLIGRLARQPRSDRGILRRRAQARAGDGEPVLGALPGVSGYHVAFTHSGATLGLIAGELLAEEIAGGEPSPLLVDLRPGRFRG